MKNIFLIPAMTVLKINLVIWAIVSYSLIVPLVDAQKNSAASSFNYTQALSKSILFYEAQRSGKLVNNRIPWRGDSFLTDVAGVDLSGGYHDAGDQMKYGFPLGHTLIFLAWGMIDFKDAYVAAGEYQNGLNGIRWGTDWILKASKMNVNTVYAQVGDTDTDHSYWGRPEDFPKTGKRTAIALTPQRPGTDLAANYASALAAASILFRQVNASYSATCLSVARQLYTFADKYRGVYSTNYPENPVNYPSSGYEDELTFAAGMMAWATGEQPYKTAAANYWTQFGFGQDVEPSFNWDFKTAGVAILLSRVLGDSKYKTAAQSQCDHWMNSQPRTPLGLVFIGEWGSLNEAMNAAYGCLMVANMNLGSPSKYRTFAKSQVDYALGSTGRSFVVGFGINPPTHVHHCAASCPNRPATCDWNTFSSPNSNGQVINGALAGGPGAKDKYSDVRDNYVQNEVAIDYNAGFQSALAGVIQAKLKGLL